VSEAAFVFRASLQERSGITFDQDEAVIRLRVPKSDKAQMVGLVALTDCELEVSVRVAPAAIKTDLDESPDEQRPQAKRRSTRSTLRVVGG
jgi:hypothetical protein